MNTIQQGADQYVNDHMTGNSYVDERLRKAYIVGAKKALESLVNGVKRNMTPVDRRLLEVKAERMVEGLEEKKG